MNPLRSAPAAWDVVAPTSQRDLRATVSATSAGSVASTRATASECPAPAVEPRLQRVLRAAGAATLESMPRKTATDPNTGHKKLVGNKLGSDKLDNVGPDDVKLGDQKLDSVKSDDVMPDDVKPDDEKDCAMLEIRVYNNFTGTWDVPDGRVWTGKYWKVVAPKRNQPIAPHDGRSGSKRGLVADKKAKVRVGRKETDGSEEEDPRR
ncbi:hypothetical protein PF005_g10687 [Phytophthora fragariae]|uniref:Uncharacterized protein n=1 Tax=Phytophthora fragariae TaxID=53985 RepID=A0A6A3Y4V2_9STRA|nr:hypothetical protein PF005_g10687 [Phytophthora fragariae]